MTARSLWRHADFMKLWSGQTVSELGSVKRTALPIVAVITLLADALKVRSLVGRRRPRSSSSDCSRCLGRRWRRPLMIATDAIRAALLLSIPAAALSGPLRIGRVGVIAGALTAEAFGIRTPLWISVEGSLAGTAFLILSAAARFPRGSRSRTRAAAANR